MSDFTLFSLGEYLDTKKDLQKSAVVQVKEIKPKKSKSKISEPVAMPHEFPTRQRDDLSRQSVVSKSSKSSKSSRSTAASINSFPDVPSRPSTATTRPATGYKENPAKSEAFVYQVAAYGLGTFEPLQQSNNFHNEVTRSWWDDKRIEETVTTNFLIEKMPNFPGQNLKHLLTQPVGFGDGLTDETYCEWIVERARKIFLILWELGIPEQIFKIVDQSWDDDDLPLDPDTVARLKLCEPQDQGMEKRFLRKQRAFLLQDITKGSHVTFEDDELVPLDSANKRQPAGMIQNDDRVTLPRKPELVMARKRIPLGDSQGTLGMDVFLEEVEALKSVSHPHVVETFASYTHQRHGYILMSPASDITLRAFIQSPSPAYKSLNREQKRRQVLSWMHCLSDALAYLDERGIHHHDIRPKSILLDGMNIFFADIGNSRSLDPSPRKLGTCPIEAERYEYGAPELWGRALQSPSADSGGLPLTSPSLTSPIIVSRPSFTTVPYSADDGCSVHSSGSTGSIPGISRASSTSNMKSSLVTPFAKTHDWASPSLSPGKTSVFSLACVFLDLLTFNSKRKLSAFSSHRSNKKKRSGARSNGQADSSFHANLTQVSSWIEILEEDAMNRKDGEDRAVLDILALSLRMLQREPAIRPGTKEVTGKLWSVVKAEGGMPHCGGEARKVRDPLAMDELLLVDTDDEDCPEWEWPWEASGKNSLRHNRQNRPLRI